MKFVTLKLMTLVHYLNSYKFQENIRITTIVHNEFCLLPIPVLSLLALQPDIRKQ